MTPDTSSERSVRSKAIEVSVAAALILAGGVLVGWRVNQHDGADLYGERQLDTPESAMLFVCPTDGATLSVTPAVYECMLASGRAGPREGAPRRSRGVYLRCPECRKCTMVQGLRCPVDGTVYAMADEHGDPCVCPLCLAATMARGLEEAQGLEDHSRESSAG